MRFRWAAAGRDINCGPELQIKSLLALSLAAWSLGVND